MKGGELERSDMVKWKYLLVKRLSFPTSLLELRLSDLAAPSLDPGPTRKSHRAWG